MEKRRKKDQERKKAFKAERMQDKMSHVRKPCLYIYMQLFICYVYRHPPAFIQVVLVFSRGEEEEVGLVQ